MGNFLDSAIAFFSPGHALRRLRQRTALELIQKQGFGARAYEGASKAERFSSWLTGGGDSANSQIKTAGSSLRTRSRDLMRNNPFAARGSQVLVANVVGDGIVPTPFDARAGKKKKTRERSVEIVDAKWVEWADSTACDFDRRHDFYGIEALVFKTVVDSGAALVRRVFDKENPGIPFKIQVLEPDFIDTSKEGRTDDWFEVQGIRFQTKTGKRLGYWLFEEHPGGSVTGQPVIKSNFVEAKDLLHIFRVDRPGQFHGVPWLAPVMVRLRDFDELENAQLLKQKISACFTAYVTTPEDLNNSNQDAAVYENLEPGAVQYLGNGQQVTVANPPSTSGYEEFSKNILRSVAVGIGVTAEALTGDLSAVNFSSGRMGWLEFHRNVKQWRMQILLPQFLNPLWAWFIEGVKLKETGDFDGILATWTPPRREFIDVTRETDAAITAVKAGMTTLSETIRERGLDPVRVFEERKQEIELLKEMGVPVSTDPTLEAQLKTQPDNEKGSDE